MIDKNRIHNCADVTFFSVETGEKTWLHSISTEIQHTDQTPKTMYLNGSNAKMKTSFGGTLEMKDVKFSEEFKDLTQDILKQSNNFTLIFEGNAIPIGKRIPKKKRLRKKYFKKYGVPVKREYKNVSLEIMN